jgi:predicted nuclease of restriction endonuclease-like (RecB) superfamily
MPKIHSKGERLFSKMSYSHLSLLTVFEDSLKRAFYEVECIKGTWSVRELKRQISTLYFERSALSKDPEALSKLTQEKTPFTPDPRHIAKDIYTFEFLGLPEHLAVEESDLETALLTHLQEFLFELGHGFCLEARQKRILIGDEYYFIDLVFYHRILKCHILIELKIGDFSHENAGQLNTYLNYYKAEVVGKGDNPPIGLLLVADKNTPLVEYAIAGMDEQLFVKKYLVNLPQPKELENFIINQLQPSS